MAGPWYVSSVNGSDASDGLSKANAKATVDGASGLFSTAFAAGETLRIDSAHNETWAADHTLAWPGTSENPNIIISIDWTPDTYLKATVRQLYTTGVGNEINWDGATKSYGMFYESSHDFLLNDNITITYMENGTVKIAAGTGALRIGSADANVEFVDVEFNSGSTGSAIEIPASVIFVWRNGPNNNSKFTTDGNENELFGLEGSDHGLVKVIGVDLTAVAVQLVLGTSLRAREIDFVNCSLPVGTTIVSSITNATAGHVAVLNCDDGTGNDLHRTEKHDHWGTTIVTDADYNIDGASDGTTNIAWKMVSSANAQEFHEPHKSLWISGWLSQTGLRTFTIETNSDNVTFEDDELWMELEFLGAEVDTQSDMVHDRMLNVDSTPSGQPLSVANPTWVTPNITTEKKQQLQVSATVLRPGPFRARVCLAKPSATVWIDPLVKVT